MAGLEIGPYRLADVRVGYDRTMMQLSAGAAGCANGDLLCYWNRYTDAIMGNEAWHETGMPDIVKLPSGRIEIIYYSFDPNLPFAFPTNETIWDPLKHICKRYLVMAVFEEK